MAVTIVSDVESIKCTSPCNPSGRSVILVEIPAFNHSNSTMQKRIPDFYIQSGYSHFVSRTYLFILKLSVIGCLFLLSFQCHQIDRDRKEYRESTLGLHGVWTIYIYTTLLQFNNTTISEDVMIVNNSLESSIA